MTLLCGCCFMTHVYLFIHSFAASYSKSSKYTREMRHVHSCSSYLHCDCLIFSSCPNILFDIWAHLAFKTAPSWRRASFWSVFKWNYGCELGGNFVFIGFWRAAFKCLPSVKDPNPISCPLFFYCRVLHLPLYRSLPTWLMSNVWCYLMSDESQDTCSWINCQTMTHLTSAVMIKNFL